MQFTITLRDALVYFVTGMSFLLFALAMHFRGCVEEDFSVWVNKINSWAKGGDENYAWLLVVFVGSYIVGHIVQSLDAMRYALTVRFVGGRNKIRRNWGIRILVYCLAGYRIAGVLYANELRGSANQRGRSFQDVSGAFWQKKHYLQIKGQYTYS